jgi:replicative DNA helicase
MHAQKPLDLVIVDYLQLMESSESGRARNQSRAEEIGVLSRGLKKLARDLGVPVLALAQLNREIEHRGGEKPPQLSDLAEGSGIEKDADVVMFLHCMPLELEKKEANQPYNIEVVVRKHRNGALGQFPLRFRPRLTRFENIAKEEGGYAGYDDKADQD